MRIKNPKEYALYLLKFKDRSERSIEEKMSQKDFSNVEIKEVLAFLKKSELIDEKRLAESITRDGLENRFWGRYRIQKKLIQEKIKKEIIEKNISEISDQDELKSATSAQEKWQKKNKVNTYEDKQKLFSFLGRRGFSWDIISELEV